MRFDAAAVRQLASLAQLDLDEARSEAFAAELTRILAYVEQLDAHPAEAPALVPELRWRADEARPLDPADAARNLEGAAGWDGAMVRVPRVVGGGEG